MKIVYLFLFLLIAALYSCTSHTTAAEKIHDPYRASDSVQQSRFANIHFASRYDTSCGMPLSAGVEDTLHYHDKIYGFCSKECKNDFINKLAKAHKR